VDYMLQRRLMRLEEVTKLGKSLKMDGDVGYTCETAAHFKLYHVDSRWKQFISLLRNPQESVSEEQRSIAELFPFTDFFSDAPQPLFGSDHESDLEVAWGCYRYIEEIFTELAECRPFELLRTARDRGLYLMSKQARIIAMTCTHAALKRHEFLEYGLKYDNLVMEESAQILEVETFIPMQLQEPQDGRARLKRIVLIGDHNQLPPVVKNMALQKYAHLDQSLFTRFVRLGNPLVQLDMQGRARPGLCDLYRWRYRELGDLDLPIVKSQPVNAGVLHDYQFINVEDYQGQGEFSPSPYFYQNLGEAEYVVAMFMYLRLRGWPAEKITILSTYNGQKHLIRDVLQKRCGWSPMFGQPARVTTVDRYQGQQNDIVLLSLVRTKTVGHLRDVRRLVVALSRARLGLYVFCRAEVFVNCFELRPAFAQMMERPDKLTLIDCDKSEERYGLPPDADREQKSVTIQDVVEMGKIVHQMTTAAMSDGHKCV